MPARLGAEYTRGRVRLQQRFVHSHYYLVNDTGLFGAGKRAKLVVGRTPIARRPNRSEFYEGRTLHMGRVVHFVLFARPRRIARFDSSCRAVRGGIRPVGSDSHSAGASFVVDPLWAVPAGPGDGAAYAARFALLEQVERGWQGGQFLEEAARRAYRSRKKRLFWHSRRDGCCQTPSTERYFLDHCCVCKRESHRVASLEGAACRTALQQWNPSRQLLSGRNSCSSGRFVLVCGRDWLWWL